MKGVTVGGLLLLVVTPLVWALHGSLVLDLALTAGLFITPAGAVFWFLTRGRRWRAVQPLRTVERPVVLAALGLFVGILLVMTGLVELVALAVWLGSAVVFVVGLVRWRRAVRALRDGTHAPAEPPFLSG